MLTENDSADDKTLERMLRVTPRWECDLKQRKGARGSTLKSEGTAGGRDHGTGRESGTCLPTEEKAWCWALDTRELMAQKQDFPLGKGLKAWAGQRIDCLKLHTSKYK